MLDIGWSELVLIGVVALIVVGPEDLPKMFHTLGRFTAKARSMAREFTRAMDDAAKESGFKEAANDLRSLTSKKGLGLDALESAAAKFEKWDPKKAMRPAEAAVAKAPGPPGGDVPAAAAAKTEAPVETPTLGPETQALADKLERKRADARAKHAAQIASRQSAGADGAAAPEPPKVAKLPPGRLRSTSPKPASGSAASTLAAAAEAVTPAQKKTARTPSDPKPAKAAAVGTKQRKSKDA